MYLLLSRAAVGATLQVPSDHATIQGAIDAANPGDVVLIEPGTYTEALSFAGRTDLTLQGSGRAITVLRHTAVGPWLLTIDASSSNIAITDLTFDGEGANALMHVEAGATGTTVDRVSFEDGFADADAACLRADADLTVTDSSFLGCTSNSQTEGAGLHVGGSAGATVVRTHFEDNMQLYPSNPSGGAAIRAGGALLVQDSAFVSNYADGNGASVWCDGNCLIDRTYFCENNAEGFGAGIYRSDSAAAADPFEVHNTIFQANQAGFGGAIYLNLRSGLFENNTFVGNDANVNGAAVRLYVADATFRNNLIVHQRGAPALEWRNGNGDYLGGTNLFFDNIDGDSNQALLPTDIVGSDPLFTDYVHGTTPCFAADLILQPGSPAIDTGDPVVGNDPDGTLPDIGAYGGPGAVFDSDADGFDLLIDGDCNDWVASVYPGAPEVCDSDDGFDVDEDCDGLSGDADPDSTGTTGLYADGDGDGLGDGALTTKCPEPGWVDNADDCDDADVAVGAATVLFFDGDGDGEGDPLVSTIDCAMPDWVDNDLDCDDADATLNSSTVWYLDGDGDGFAGDVTSVVQCGRPSPDWYLVADDCDDADASLNPDTPWFLDGDGDGYGAGAATPSCLSPTPAHVRDATDCDDAAFAVNPGATEVCNSGIDDDCTGLADDADPGLDSATASTFYPDTDADGVGSGSAQLACVQPLFTAPVDGDCNDGDSAIYPGAPELCDDLDNDCDLSIDEDLATLAWYPDLDGDGFGEAGSVAVDDCAQPSGFVGDDTDCDDTSSAVNPDALEVCNGGIDDDCTGLADDLDPGLDSASGTPYYTDIDGDGFGSGSAQLACVQPVSTAPVDGDCNDGDSATYPGAPELCDDQDNDCDLSIDEDLATLAWYPDRDGDGFGDAGASAVDDCAQLDGFVTDATDCDDAAFAVNPDGTEVCEDGIDNDCVDGDRSCDRFGAWEDDDPDNAPRCGCDTRSAAGGWVWGLLGILALRRRRAA